MTGVARRASPSDGCSSTPACATSSAATATAPSAAATTRLSPDKAAFAEWTNPRGFRGSADEALAGADVYIGLSGPGAVSAEAVRTMAGDAIVFAMANPTPEVQPEDIDDAAAVIATGRSDYPNQINNVLAFPGVFRGALDVRASSITPEMNLAAAHAIAGDRDARGARGGLHHPERLQPRRRPCCGCRGGGGRPGRRRRAARIAQQRGFSAPRDVCGTDVPVHSCLHPSSMEESYAVSWQGFDGRTHAGRLDVGPSSLHLEGGDGIGPVS